MIQQPDGDELEGKSESVIVPTLDGDELAVQGRKSPELIYIGGRPVGGDRLVDTAFTVREEVGRHTRPTGGWLKNGRFPVQG